MARFDEMSVGSRILILLGVAFIIGALYWFFYFNGKLEEIRQLQTKLDDKNKENEMLRPYESRLAELNRSLVILEMQIERVKKVVPEEKNDDQFIRLLHDTAANSGIEIRRYMAMPAGNHEFYTDVPFTIDIDGPYYQVLTFFSRVADLERIVTIDNMQMANTKDTGPSKIKTKYDFAPGETVVASCTATTFFSHEQEAVPPAPGTGPARPGQPAAAQPPGGTAPPAVVGRPPR
jgi:type IV pilus assembly protein PilO